MNSSTSITTPISVNDKSNSSSSGGGSGDRPNSTTLPTEHYTIIDGVPIIDVIPYWLLNIIVCTNMSYLDNRCLPGNLGRFFSENIFWWVWCGGVVM